MSFKRIRRKLDIMNKKEYIAPTIKITVCDLQDSFLAGSGNDKLWQPEQNGSTPGIKEEGKDGILPDEITGSKEHNGWNGSWDDSWD